MSYRPNPDDLLTPPDTCEDCGCICSFGMRICSDCLREDAEQDRYERNKYND